MTSLKKRLISYLSVLTLISTPCLNEISVYAMQPAVEKPLAQMTMLEVFDRFAPKAKNGVILNTLEPFDMYIKNHLDDEEVDLLYNIVTNPNFRKEFFALPNGLIFDGNGNLLTYNRLFGTFDKNQLLPLFAKNGKIRLPLKKNGKYSKDDVWEASQLLSWPVELLEGKEGKKPEDLYEVDGKNRLVDKETGQYVKLVVTDDGITLKLTGKAKDAIKLSNPENFGIKKEELKVEEVKVVGVAPVQGKPVEVRTNPVTNTNPVPSYSYSSTSNLESENTSSFPTGPVVGGSLAAAATITVGWAGKDYLIRQNQGAGVQQVKNQKNKVLSRNDKKKKLRAY